MAARVMRLLKRRAPVIAVALVLVASVRIIATYAVFSHTVDEPFLIAYGTEWLDLHTYHDAEQPPLAPVAAALGPHLLGAHWVGTNVPDPNHMWTPGLAILFQGHRYGLLLAAARLCILPFFWLACAVVWWSGKRWFDPPTAVAAVFLFSFLPPVLAHAGLATTDMALTATFGAAFLALVIWTGQPSAARALILGVATGLTVLSKFSCLIYFPVTAALALAGYFFLRGSPSRGAPVLRRHMRTLPLAMLVSALVVWAGYRFSFARIPAPELLEGIHMVANHNAFGHISYLLGQRSQVGFHYFFPVVLAVKTPLAFLALAALGILAAWRRPLGWLPIFFAAGILLPALFSRIDIGVRHVLPIYLALSLLAAAGGMRLLELSASRRWAGWLLAGLLAWFAGVSIASHPDYLAYCNELAGSRPENVLVDSDLDWGQDLKRLASRLREVHATSVAFTPFDFGLLPGDLERELGFPRVTPSDAATPSPGWNAISLSFWKTRRLGLYNSRPEVVPWPARVPYGERVGKGMLLFYFPPAGGK